MLEIYLLQLSENRVFIRIAEDVLGQRYREPARKFIAFISGNLAI